MSRKLVSSLCLVLLCGAVAEAGVIGVTTKRANPGSNAPPYDGFAASTFTTDTGLNSGAPQSTWVSYALGVQSTAGEKISAIDVRIFNNAATAATANPVTGIPSAPVFQSTNGFHQRWTFNADTEVFDPTPISTNITNGDSHLFQNGAAVGRGSTEDNNNSVASPPAAPDTAANQYGVGSYLNGAWGFNQAQQDAQTAGGVVNFAYLVIPRGMEDEIVMDIRVSTNPLQPGGAAVLLDAADFPGFGALQGVAPTVTNVLVDNVNSSVPGLVQGTITDDGTGTDPITWSGGTLTSFTPSHGAPVAQGNAEAANFVFNPATQQFSWNTVGAPRGQYVFGVTATNAFGSDPGTITVNVTAVPEPATFGLVGLALVGLVGLRRRG